MEHMHSMDVQGFKEGLTRKYHRQVSQVSTTGKYHKYHKHVACRLPATHHQFCTETLGPALHCNPASSNT
jgi:hypothetical protein